MPYLKLEMLKLPREIAQPQDRLEASTAKPPQFFTQDTATF